MSKPIVPLARLQAAGQRALAHDQLKAGGGASGAGSPSATWKTAQGRIQPWVAALAAGRRDIGLKRVWRGTGPLFGTILRGWFAFVFPFYAAHVALTFAAIELLPFGGAHIALAELDAFASTAALFAALLLNATVFRWVSGEAIPAPRPFGTAAPDAELVAQARCRLRVLMAGTPRVRGG